MNNQQFRRLLEPSPANGNGSSPPAKAGTAPASSLGTKKSSFIPMTPRNVKGGIDVDFARQVRERNAALQPTKKFKTAVPKGVKYGAGYTDRAKARAEAGDAEDDKGSRIKALEEQMKLGQIDEETFLSLRDEITGGDVGSTHLVKGLDRQLLERVRRGEDVLGTGGSSAEGGAADDIDDELEKLEGRQVEAMKKERVQKKGNMAPPSIAGVKRSRDEIMAELRAQRKAAAEAKAAPALDTSKWRKVGEKKSRVEVDHKGREVLITVDEDGVVKKKVRKRVEPDNETSGTLAGMPDASKAVLGADIVVPEQQQDVSAHQDDDDDDIFDGVGTEYNPLGEEDSGEEDSESEKEPSKVVVMEPREDASSHTSSPLDDENDDDDIPPAESRPQQPFAPSRSYFKDTMSSTDDSAQDRHAGIQDLLKKAAKLDPTRSATDDDDDGAGGDEEQKARLQKRAEMLAQQDRDLEDMDMGFGGARYDDGDEDGEGKKMRLSEWKGGVDDGWQDDGKEGGKEKKKRKPKKRKGDANNMSDIMKVIEKRKGEGAK